MSGAGGIVDRLVLGAPAALRDRMRAALEVAPAVDLSGGVDPAGRAPAPAPAAGGEAERLAAAAFDRLRRVLASSGTRETALDLLAADALLTHACEVAAGAGPDELGSLARIWIDELARLLPPEAP